MLGNNTNFQFIRLRALEADAWRGGNVKEGMIQEGWTDVRARLKTEENIFVFSPATLESLPNGGIRPDLEGLLDLIMDLRLAHAGTLNFIYNPLSHNSYNIGWKFSKCGAPLRFKSHWRDESLERWGIQTFFFCPHCGIRIGLRLTEPEFSQLILYLAIKNAVPEMKMCNVFDTHSGLRPIAFSRENMDTLKVGESMGGREKPPFDFLRPGFIPTQKVQECSFFWENHSWLELLFLKYKDHIDASLSGLSRVLGGPRRR